MDATATPRGISLAVGELGAHGRPTFYMTSRTAVSVNRIRSLRPSTVFVDVCPRDTQLDQNGDANSWSLGEELAQDEVRAMMLDYQRAPSRSHSVSSSTGRTLQVDGDLELRQLDRCTVGVGRWLPRRHPFIDGRLHRRRPWAIQRGLRRPARDRGTETVVLS